MCPADLMMEVVDFEVVLFSIIPGLQKEVGTLGNIFHI